VVNAHSTAPGRIFPATVSSWLRGPHNATMQALRNSLSLTRLVLAWFMLTLSIAMASPIVHPKAIEVVCTSSGSMQVIMLDEDGQAAPGLHHSLDCPLCLTITTPPSYSSPHLEQPQPLGWRYSL
jgi:hypothetical protein